MSLPRAGLAAPLTAAAMMAVQVASNAARDALFLSYFPVAALPHFMAASAVLSVFAAQASGRLLARFGPARLVPALMALGAALFLAERTLLAEVPRWAAVLLYLQATVLGGLTISAFWSLLNERFDPHSAKPLMARVAGAAAFGGLLGGAAAERAGALASASTLLLGMTLLAFAAAAGAARVGRAMPRAHAQESEDAWSGWTEIRRVPLLRRLAAVVVLAAVVAALADYALKAEAVAHLGTGEPLVRFFGLFYGATGLLAFLMQATLGRFVLARLGLGGSVAAHPALVGGAVLLGFVLPPPWRGLLPRGLDVSVRASVFRAGYELLYTPLPEASKRAAKSIIDVAGDCLGKGAGAAAILLLALALPQHVLLAVNVAAVSAAVAELLAARGLRGGYVRALEGGLVRRGEDLEAAAQLSLSDFTVLGSLSGLDRAAVLQAVAGAEAAGAGSADPVLAAAADLRSGDPARMRAALRQPPSDPLLIGALIPALERRDTLRGVVAALCAYGTRAAGQLVDALLDPATPDSVRRRLPLVLKSCASPLARDGLVMALDAPSFEVRLRCGRALLWLTDDHPELAVAARPVLAALEREVAGQGDSPDLREHIFNLLALALEREPARIAARAFDGGDAYVRGTALEYLETVLPSHVFAALEPRLTGQAAAAPRRRAAAEVRAELLDAGASLNLSAPDVRRQLGLGEDEAD